MYINCNVILAQNKLFSFVGAVISYVVLIPQDFDFETILQRRQIKMLTFIAPLHSVSP